MICAIMGSVLTSTTVDSGLETRGRTKLKTIQLACCVPHTYIVLCDKCVSLPSVRHYVLCIALSASCNSIHSECNTNLVVSWHYDNRTNRVGLVKVQSGYHHHLIEI